MNRRGEYAAKFFRPHDERVRQADAHFALAGETTAAVARLVRRLDGMPLAIELAAARVEALGVAGLLDRIEDRFALLTGGDRLAPGRHRSLAAMVAWSYRLLEERERRVFRLISVFPGSFTLEAAEAVAGEAAGPAVLWLVDCSLLVPPRAWPDGRSRYVMLETLRAYAAGLLAETGEQDGAAAALAGYALQVAGQAAAGSQSGDGELAAARWLDAEDATTRQGLAWALAAALAGRASVLRLMGRAAEAAGDGRRALALAREIGYPAGELGALVELSLDAYYAGDHDEEVRLARQAGQITAGIRGGAVRMCSSVLTTVLAGAGNLAEAERAGAAGLARARDAGDLFNQAVVLPRIADLDLRAGRTGDAAVHLREGLRLAVRTGSWLDLRIGLSQCGNLCAATGRAAEALTLWAACAAASQREEPADPPWFETRWKD